MRKLLCVLALCLAMGCGPSFVGAYKGDLITTGSCTDGSSVNATDTIEWTLTESGLGGTATFPGACSALSVSYAGNVATFAPKTCTPILASGITFTTTIEDGTGTLRDGALALVLHSTAIGTSSSVSGTCNETMEGTLTKQ